MDHNTAIDLEADIDAEKEERRDNSLENQHRRSIYDVAVTATISIGQKKMRISDLLDLQADSVIALSAKIDDPVDLTVEDRVIARGDLIELDDGVLALKLTEIGELSNG
ncbi:MAG: FliM/FliN family flagellar motor switch protein [Pseudomonadota bacterium]